MGLDSNLISIKQREVSGSLTSSRFQYQFCWALTRLMELHEKQSDYVMGFEYHDDVIDLDKQDNPEQINFHQVKTRSQSLANWTLNAVSNPKKNEKLSIVAKMYQNNVSITEAKKLSCCFVTNKHMNFTIDNKTEFSAHDLEENQRETISQRIAEQLKINQKDVDLNRILFHRTDLSLEDFDNHLIGKVHKFFDDQKLGKTKVHSWLQHMLKEIKLRNDYPANKIKTYDDFLIRKAITKTDVQTLLDEISKSENTTYPMFEEVLRPKLIHDKADVLLIKKLGQNWEQISSEIINPTNEVLHNLKATVQQELTKYQGGTADTVEMMSALYQNLRDKHKWDENIFPEHYIKAMILWVYCEQE